MGKIKFGFTWTDAGSGWIVVSSLQIENIVQPVDSTSLARPKWNLRRRLWQSFLPLPSECWLLDPSSGPCGQSWFCPSSLLFIVFAPLWLARLRLKCRRTGQDLTDLFSPNIHGLSHFVPFPLVIRGIFVFAFLCLAFETREKSAFWSRRAAQIQRKSVGLVLRRFHQFWATLRGSDSFTGSCRQLLQSHFVFLRIETESKNAANLWRAARTADGRTRLCSVGANHQ